jgi:3-oxoacyl-[acyl-carrier protein] reductase
MFEDHVVIVTGGGRGIGAAACRLYAEQGAKVVVCDLDLEPANAMAEAIKKAGGKAIAIAGNVTDTAFPDKLMGAAIDAFGKINVIVNNAGYTWDGMVHKMTDEQWDAIIAVHNTAPFRIIRAAAPHLRDVAKRELDQHGKSLANRVIVNISSTSGLHGNVGQANYSCAKMGVVGLTKCIAKEWGPFGVRCNAVAFGFIQTRLTGAKEEGQTMKVGDKEVAIGIPDAMRGRANTGNPLGRPGVPDEGAAGILFMSSPWGSYITGHCLEVTGGAGI